MPRGVGDEAISQEGAGICQDFSDLHPTFIKHHSKQGVFIYFLNKSFPQHGYEDICTGKIHSYYYSTPPNVRVQVKFAPDLHW